MKQPRTDDFDPNATKRTLKSSMDSMPTIEKPPAVSTLSADKLTVQALPTPATTELAQQLAPTTSSTPKARAGKQQSNKRLIKTRHPFDIYQDQADELKRLAYEEKMQGGLGSMSAMVREALDAYLTKRR